MTSKKYLTELHEDHLDWSKRLQFYAEELKFMDNELAAISLKNTNTEVKIRVEQFQNRFIIQGDEIAVLKETINNEEQLVTESVMENPTASDHRKLTDNNPLRERIEVFIPIFEDLKKEFKKFLVEVI